MLGLKSATWWIYSDSWKWNNWTSGDQIAEGVPVQNISKEWFKADAQGETQ